MSKSVGLLVRRGWVERSTPEDNRRQITVSATPEGRRVFAEMRRDAERHVARMLAPLGSADRERVDAALATLIKVLSSAVRNDVSER
jgi:DNA-binding MarR family transcriptional regulator